jgi:Major Facilitator Superfamily
VVAYYALRDLIPFYGVYALMFSDRGLSAAQISSLFVIWSVASFLCEIPSGAWADTVDRRLLLVLSAVLYAAAFAAWTAFAGYLGFAAGFALWGVSGALMSGTFEALVYESLAARSATPRYPQVIGWARSAAVATVLAGTVLGTPLYAWGGYPLVGWTSVAIAGVHGLLAWTLPTDPSARRAAATDPTRRYLAMLRSGVGEAARHSRVRRMIAIYAVMFGLTAYDEYFPILARDGGIATIDVPLLVGLMTLGQLVGTALAGRTAAMSGPVMAMLVGSSAVLVSVGALGSGPAGLAAITVGYGIVHNTIVVGEARLQQSITSGARATVTSVAGLSTEVIVLAVYASFAIGSSWLSIATIVALLGVPMVGVGGMVARWLPPYKSGTDT